MRTLNVTVLRIWLAPRSIGRWVGSRLAGDETGEGVISAAIAILVMAFLGVAMWVAFKTILGSTGTEVSNQVSKIGS